MHATIIGDAARTWGRQTMKVFILGGGGFIGGGVARGFRSAGYRVTTMSQTQEGVCRLRRLEYDAPMGSMTEPGPWLDELATADVVVYAAQSRAGKRLTSSWLAKSRATRDAALKLILPILEKGGKCKAFLYTSGIVVVGDHGAEIVSESTRRSKTALGDFHAESEALILEAAVRGLPAVILRPGFVYGPDGSFAEFFIKEAKKGFYPYPGRGSNFIPWVHIDDLAEAYVLAADNPPVGEVIHVVDDEPIRLADFARTLVNAAGGGRTMGMPKWLVALIAGAPLVEMLTASYRSSNDKAKRLLGWKPLHPTIREGLPSVFEAYSRQAVTK
jgi:nucleoside-diphosphate-sugar epimerase